MFKRVLERRDVVAQPRKRCDIVTRARERRDVVAHVRRRSAAIAWIGVVLAARAWSQCPGWNLDATLPVLDGPVYAFQPFAEANGPILYAGGFFVESGGTLSGIEGWDGSHWAPMSESPNDVVGAMCVFDDGSGPALYAGGSFTQVGAATLRGIARWNGTSWSDVGGGLALSGSLPKVWSMCVYDDGGGPALYVGGTFDQAGSTPVSNLARWNGTSWSDVGGGVSGGQVVEIESMTVFNDGTGSALWLGGYFDAAGASPAQNLAAWHGSTSSWQVPVGADDLVRALAVYDGGGGPALYVGGYFQHVGGIAANYVARYDGAWASMIEGVSGTFQPVVTCLRAFNDGSGPSLFVGGSFVQAGSHEAHSIARWNGIDWSALDPGVQGTVEALGAFDDPPGGASNLYVGGYFNAIGTTPVSDCASWHTCVDPVNAYCFGDGTLAACPCGNSGATGRGCENSASTGGAQLIESGTVHPDAVVLRTSGELPSALTIFLQGDQSISPVPFGDGLRCAAGHLKRLYIKHAVAGTASAPAAGDLSISQRSLALGDPIVPATGRYYQAYYRDPNMSFCASPAGNTWNVTNAIRVLW